MILLHMMKPEVLTGYLDHLDKVEAQSLLHLLLTVVANKSIIETFTFSTFEQVAYGIDTFHTVKKIKRLLKEPLTLMAYHVCNHQFVGQMIDSFF
jgi:hypothetical protein